MLIEFKKGTLDGEDITMLVEDILSVAKNKKDNKAFIEFNSGRKPRSIDEKYEDVVDKWMKALVNKAYIERYGCIPSSEQQITGVDADETK